MSSDRFAPDAGIAALAEYGVAFVVIGGIAANAQGSPSATFDLDICYERSDDNLAKLASCLKALHAHLRGAPRDVPFLLDAKTLRMGDAFTFDTDAGSLDCLGTPAGTNGYEQIRANAIELEIAGHIVSVASIDDLIRMKRAAGRPKDRIELEVLGALREEIDALEAKKRKRRRKAPPRKR